MISLEIIWLPEPLINGVFDVVVVVLFVAVVAIETVYASDPAEGECTMFNSMIPVLGKERNWHGLML